MRRLFFLSAVTFTLAATVARAEAVVIIAEPESRQRNMLLVNPGDLLSGVVSLEYEVGVASWLGLTAGVSLWSFHSVFAPPTMPYYTAIAPEVGFRIHFIRNAPRGLWIGPYISAGYLLARSDGDLFRAWSWGLGGALGYNFLLGRHFTFQLGAGGGFIDYGDHIAWDPRLKLGIGATF